MHEKGGMEHTLEFASRADIIVTCCTLNPSTVGILSHILTTEDISMTSYDIFDLDVLNGECRLVGGQRSIQMILG